nr:hypothetical protein [Tanacetum cinerariifolium]
MVNAIKDNFDKDDLVKFQELLLDAEKPLYEGCPDFTKLFAIVRLLNLKDSQAWRTIDENFPEIAEDPRNLRLGISADEVDVTIKNRHHNTGVDTYDVSTKDNFNLRSIMLWTINDYHVLGTLGGCPRYLPYNHPFRKQKKAFNGQQEFLPAPIPMTGEQKYNKVQHIENKYGKGKQTNNKASKNKEDMSERGRKIQKHKRNTTKEEDSSSQVNGQNEKNVAESLVGTLLHVLGKTIDRVNARLDLAELGVKLKLFAMQEEDKTTLPPAGYTLANVEKDTFCEMLHNIRVLQGRNKPEGCIAEETITKETIEFFSEYHKSIETIGIPPDKHETDENEEGKPLSAANQESQASFENKKPRGFLTAKGRGSRNGVKEKRDSVVNYPNMVHGDVNPNSDTSIKTNTLNNLGKSPGNEIVNHEMPSSSISTTPVLFGTLNMLNMGPISYVNVGSAVPTSYNKNGSEQKLEANLPNDADYDVWLPLASVHEELDTRKKPFVLNTSIRCSTCLLFGHSLDDCPKAAPKRVDKCKGHIPMADDEGFIEVNQKKSCVNYGGNKHFESVLVKPKTQYLPKAKQSTAGTCNSPKMAPLASTNKALISDYNKESPSNNGNGFSIRNLFEALNVDDLIIEEVATGSKEQEGYILFGLPGSRQQKFLVLRFLTSRSSKVSNDDTAVTQRRLEDKQPEEKTNTDCLVKEQEKEYQTRWKIKTGNVLDSCNQRSTQQYKKSRVAKYLGVVGIQQQNGLVDETNVTLFAKVHCFLIQSGLSKVFWAEDTTMSTYLVNRSSLSAIGFIKPIDMLRIFGWLASIKKGMLEPVKVKCIFLVYHKNIMGNKLWRLDDVTSKVVLYRNMGFNESEEYKKTFIGSSVGTGSMQVLHGFEFEVEPLGNHTFEVEPQENVDQGAGLQEVQSQDLIYYHLARDREQHLACELFGYREDINEAAFAVVVVEKIYAHESPTFNNTVACEVISKWKAGMKDDMDAWLDVYVLSNNDMVFSCGCKAEIWATKGLLDKAKGNVLGMEIVRNQSDGFDRGLQTYVQVFMDFDYTMGRSITRYGFMILGCAGSLKANLQHMEALSTTKAGYMTFTEAWKKYMALTEAVKEAIWLRGLLEELGVELNRVTVNCDNQGAIHLSRNHVFYERSKYINVRYHFIREVLEAKKVKVLKVGTEHNVADALMKVVPGHKLQHCLELLSVGIG